MGLVVFTALRSLLPAHAEGDEVTLNVDLQDAIRGRLVRRDTPRASDGNPETLYHGADTKWELEIAPVSGTTYAMIKEFLDSTAGGELFRIWAYGTEAAPISCYRMGGYAPKVFQRTGQKGADSFAVRFSATEAS